MATNSFFKNAALAASFPLGKLLKLPGYAERHSSSTGLRWWPFAYEVILYTKKSLAERIHNLLKQRQQREAPALSPTHASLDPSLLLTLETLVQLITDACIDSRNFDSNSFRQTSSDVNDALVMFLRDLYSLIHPAHVHRLLFVYFSRYILKEGKHCSNRDSKIGLRCAWETCKFRLNAVS